MRRRKNSFKINVGTRTIGQSFQNMIFWEETYQSEDENAIVDGDDPFYRIKLNSVSFGVPEQTASQYIQPLAEILQRVQNDRIESFNEQVRRHQEEKKQKKQREAECQRQEELQI